MENQEQNISKKKRRRRKIKHSGMPTVFPIDTQHQRKEYESLFINSSSAQILHRKCIYVDEKFVELISRLVSVNKASKLTIGGYVNSVLEKHFEIYRDEIQAFYKQNVSKDLNI